MPKLIFSAIIGLGALGAAPIAHAQTDQFLGEVRDFGFDFCPTGWYQTNGQLLPISTNTALFSLLGTLYGGDGTTTFALPTLRPRWSATGWPLTPCIAATGVFPSRS